MMSMGSVYAEDGEAGIQIRMGSLEGGSQGVYSGDGEVVELGSGILWH
jgi:hypothetical protein